MSRTLVIGDIHGGAKALQQVLDRSGFDKKSDQLITLGDYVDGWSETYEVIEILLSIPNRISMLGNHDEWFRQWIEKGVHPVGWLHGGAATAQSYANYANRDITQNPVMGGFVTNLTYVDMPAKHIAFFQDLHLYYTDSKGRVFLHAGFDRNFSISETKAACPYMLYWDRQLWQQALSAKINKQEELMTVDNFKEIFIGHTATTNWQEQTTVPLFDGGGNVIKVDTVKKPITTPMNAANVWNLDTGGGFNGRLTIMDVNTKMYWQSDRVQTLYNSEKGRN